MNFLGGLVSWTGQDEVRRDEVKDGGEEGADEKGSQSEVKERRGSYEDK